MNKNLIPLNQRAKDEQREIARMGGKARGKQRREQKTVREAMQQIMSLQVQVPEIQKFLDNVGISDKEKTWAVALAATTIRNAIKNPSFARLAFEMLGENDVQGVQKCQPNIEVVFSDKVEKDESTIPDSV